MEDASGRANPGCKMRRNDAQKVHAIVTEAIRQTYKLHKHEDSKLLMKEQEKIMEGTF